MHRLLIEFSNLGLVRISDSYIFKIIGDKEDSEARDRVCACVR